MNIFRSLLLWGLVAVPLHAAPPVLNYLDPPGGQRGTTVTVTCNGTFAKWPVRVWANDPNLQATATPMNGKLTVAIGADVAPGVYWLRVVDDEGASNLRPFVVGTLPDVAEQEPNDDLAKAHACKGAVVVHGRLAKAGDVDVYACVLKPGETLMASLLAHQILRSPVDAILQVVASNGTVLEQNNDHAGLDPQVTFTAKSEGTYYVRLFAFPAMPDSSIRFFGGDSSLYRLTLTTGAFADYATPLAVTRNAKTSVTLHGWNLPESLKTLPLTPTKPRESLWHAQLGNTVAVLTEEHPCFHTFGERPKELTPPFSLTGQLQKPEAKDTFAVQVKKGQPLQVRVDSAELGLAVTPVLRLLDGAKQLARAEPAALNKDVLLSYTPTADATLQVEVSDLFHHAGPRSVYRLRVTPPEPDLSLSVANDRLAVPMDKPLEVPVTVAWRNVSAQPLEVRVEGLPKGLTVETVPPKGKDDKTVLLRFTAKEAGAAGSVRLVGVVKDRPALTRAATAPLPEFETTTEFLWLSAGGSAPPPAKPKKK